jgi:hypothetical protein
MGDSWVTNCNSSVGNKMSKHYVCEPVKCKCGKPITRLCKDTPNGGWGTLKCGEPLCDECKCDCTKVMVY